MCEIVTYRTRTKGDLVNVGVDPCLFHDWCEKTAVCPNGEAMALILLITLSHVRKVKIIPPADRLDRQ